MRFLFLLLFAACASAAERPNILFIFADDWGRYASCYSAHIGRASPSDVVKTPNIDRIAREGILFKNAFASAPSCTPCRSSLLSGQYFFRTGRGAILSGAQWDTAIPSWPLLLRDAGYHIGKTGKVWSPGTPADAPFDGQKYAYEKSGRTHNNFSENVTGAVAKGVSLEDARSAVLAEVNANFESFLADRKEGQPWCYWFGTTTTHRTWVKGSGKALWGIDPAALGGKLPKFLPHVPEIREDFADYLGEIQALDAYIGVILRRLEQTGELDRTLIVVSGDHGAPGFTHGKCNLYDFGTGVALVARVPGGKPGRVVDDYINLMDLAPTFLAAAGLEPTPAMTGRSALNVLRSENSGQVDPDRKWVITGRERHVDTAREGNLPYPQRALRTPDFLYIRNFAPERWPMGAPYAVTDTDSPSERKLANDTRVAFPDMDASPTKAWLIANRHAPEWQSHYDQAFAKRPGEELYDLRKDPDQTKNVALNPHYAATRQQLSSQLLKSLTEAKDPRVTAKPVPYDNPPFTDSAR
jgi:N-sulfoglucosamine sulfohydrolase